MAAVLLQQARQAYAGHRWDVACEHFAVAAAVAELGIDDLAAYADAAWWLGRTDDSLELSEQLYRRCLQDDQAPAAARLAVEIGFLWLLRGEEQIGSGWNSRAHRLLADAPEARSTGTCATSRCWRRSAPHGSTTRATSPGACRRSPPRTTT